MTTANLIQNGRKKNNSKILLHVGVHVRSEVSWKHRATLRDHCDGGKHPNIETWKQRNTFWKHQCPGFRPIGVGEILRRIIGKAIMTVTNIDVQNAVGSLQLCGGQPAGVEAAVHAMSTFFDADDTDGILLIDADNAFNRINRGVALWNVQFTCPAMKTILINMYRSDSRIFMQSERSFFELLSCEGTTQGCPLAMAMYALALVPLSKEVYPCCQQVWYADDATGCDSFSRLLGHALVIM